MEDNNPYIILCKICNKPVRMMWQSGGNSHTDCYWNWAHKAFTRGSSAGSIPGKSLTANGEDSQPVGRE